MSSRVGYTDDGKVFMHIPHQGNQGEPLETTIMWEPEMAKEMGGFLIDAAEAAAAKKAEKEPDNDSATTNRGRT